MSSAVTPLAGSHGGSGRVFNMGARGWALVLLLCLLAGFGVAMLYSVAGDPGVHTPSTPWWKRGAWEPWAAAHALRFGGSLFLMVVVATAIPMRTWRILAYPAYFLALALLAAVEIRGETAMGATRWIQVGPLQLQPSEIMKLALVLALARYYHDLRFSSARAVLPFAHVPPLLMIAIPAVLIVRQPDLGTAFLLLATGMIAIFLSGLRWSHILLGGLVSVMGAVGLFAYGLRPYQRDRVLSFMNADNNDKEFLLGAGYHAMQAKIAIGSGGIIGKGFGEGTQSQLDFLPEKHTDFIFTVVGEELGFIGCVALLAICAAILAVCLSIAMSSRHQFGRLVAIGAAAMFACYVFINTAMVMSVMPVVGVPLPLVSYGGTAMITVMAAFGLVLNVHLNQEEELPREGGR